MKAKHWQTTDANCLLINIISDVNGKKMAHKISTICQKIVTGSTGMFDDTKERGTNKTQFEEGRTMQPPTEKGQKGDWCMVFNATFNNISAITWRSHNQRTTN